MTKHNPTHLAINTSKLVRIFSDSLSSDVEISHENFAEKLARLIDFSGSIALSEALGQQAKAITKTNRPPTQTAAGIFLQHRADIVQFIAKRFLPQGTYPVAETTKPTLEEVTQKGTVFLPYQKFYLSNQIETNTKVVQLHTKIRDIALGDSDTLAQLVRLDSALFEAISASTRKFYTIIPKLLEKKFQQLQTECQKSNNHARDWLQTNGGFDRFSYEMAQALLAELDIRLQPVLGLVKALTETKKRVCRIND